MTTKVFITIDTEEDNWSCSQGDCDSVKNIDRLPFIQKVFDRFEAVPTYLVNYPVVKNDRSCNILRSIRNEHSCEVGLHIHPWNTPPFEESDSKSNTMLCNLGEEIIRKKITTLHEFIQNRLDLNPKSFRAGRWGFGAKVAKCISELDYKIDSSVTPLCDWADETGPDFSEALPFPYRFSPLQILTKDPNGPLVEIPPTIGFLQRNFSLYSGIRKWLLHSNLAKYHVIGLLEYLRVVNFRWLSPELSTSSDLIKLSKNIIHNGNENLNMTFHSNSLLPGKSPFVKSETQLRQFLRRIRMFLEFAKESHFEFCSLKDAVVD